MTAVRRRFALVAVLAVAAGTLAVIVGTAAPAQGVTFAVTTTADTTDVAAGDGLCRDAVGQCSLRAAIQETNVLAGPDAIRLGPGVFTLGVHGRGENAAATGDLDITDSLAITGAGSGATTIDGDRIDRVFDFRGGTPPLTHSLTGLTVTGGDANGGGGGIAYNPSLGSATLSMSNVTVSGNTATLDGGGIFARATVLMTSVTITGNTADSDKTNDGEGGGLFVTFDGVVSLSNTMVTGNEAHRGGGIYFESFGTSKITGSTVGDNNRGRFGGGGIYVANTTLNITGSQIGPNTADVVGAGGGILVLETGTVTISDSTISGNRAHGGAGLLNSGTLTVRDSTVFGNSADTGDPAQGGGLWQNEGTSILANVTFSGNIVPAWSRGGGLHVTGGTVIGNGLTVTANSGGFAAGLYRSGGAVTLGGSILAGNTDLDCFSTSPLASSGFLLMGNNSGCEVLGGLGNQIGTPGAPIDPMLGPLNLNGGSVATHALLAGSPALDKVPPDICAALLGASPTDARKVPRPQGAACDIGAYEHQVPPPPPPPSPGFVGHDAGLVDPHSGQWHLRNATSGALTSFFFGTPGDIPFMGDWDCDGDETPGLYRQSDGFVYIRNSNTQGPGEIKFFFGNPDDVPLAGDFNGNGCDTVSVYRPGETKVYITNTLGPNNGVLPQAETVYFFGTFGDKPYVGDFDGDGTETIGLHRESNGFVYFRNTHTTGVANNEYFFGNPGDRLVAGDWGVVDGIYTPAVFRPADQTFYLRHTNTLGVADSEFVWPQPGASTWQPVSGVMGL